MFFDEKEILIWERELHEKKMQSMYPLKKRYKDPRKKKLKNFRRPDKYFHYSKESSIVKQICRKSYRNKMKQLIRNNKYDSLHKPIKTQGWITW